MLYLETSKEAIASSLCNALDDTWYIYKEICRRYIGIAISSARGDSRRSSAPDCRRPSAIIRAIVGDCRIRFDRNGVKKCTSRLPYKAVPIYLLCKGTSRNTVVTVTILNSPGNIFVSDYFELVLLQCDIN